MDHYSLCPLFLWENWGGDGSLPTLLLLFHQWEVAWKFNLCKDASLLPNPSCRIEFVIEFLTLLFQELVKHKYMSSSFRYIMMKCSSTIISLVNHGESLLDIVCHSSYSNQRRLSVYSGGGGFFVVPFCLFFLSLLKVKSAQEKKKSKHNNMKKKTNQLKLMEAK